MSDSIVILPGYEFGECHVYIDGRISESDWKIIHSIVDGTRYTGPRRIFLGTKVQAEDRFIIEGLGDQFKIGI